MKKIPTMFERDWNGDRSRVLDVPAAGCEWVFAGEGIPTRKYDGTCCMVRDGLLFKRHEVKTLDKAGRPLEVIREPVGFEAIDRDPETGKITGWVPVGDGPEDKWHREALAHATFGGRLLAAGTYELLGPKVQGNPEHEPEHRLLAHADAARFLPVATGAVPRTYAALADWFARHPRDVEGIVFHHPDGRMAKIKGRDFGIKRS